MESNLFLELYYARISFSKTIPTVIEPRQVSQGGFS